MNVSDGSENRRQESPARFLPLISTAEMTLSHLCSAGDEDARALFRALGLNEDEIPDSPATILSPEQRLTRTAFLETRRCVTDALAELTEVSLYVDLPRAPLGTQGEKLSRIGSAARGRGHSVCDAPAA